MMHTVFNNIHPVFNNIHPVFNNIHPVFNKHSATLCALLIVLHHLHFLVYMPYRENTIIYMQIVKKSHQYKCTQFKEKSQDLVSRRAHSKRSMATPHFFAFSAKVDHYLSARQVLIKNLYIGAFWAQTSLNQSCLIKPPMHVIVDNLGHLRYLAGWLCH